MSERVANTAATPVLVVGDLMLDHYLWGHAERISPEAPVPVVDVQREHWALGGAGNVAANLRALDTAVRLVSVVGPDAGLSRLRQLLSPLHITDEGLIIDESRPVTVKTRLMAAHHQLVRFDLEQRDAPAPAVLSKIQGAIQDALAACRAVILSDYNKGLLTETVCQQVIAGAQARGIPVIVDPKGREYGKYRGATLITPNRKEAADAVGFVLDSEAAMLRAGEQLRSHYGLQACLITLSEDGMALFQDGLVDRIPTRAREVFDVTGAGDTVVAALASQLAEGADLVEACRFANLAAGVVVGKLGAACATRREVEDFARTTTTTAAEAKVLDRAQLERRVAELRQRGLRIVFTNGCFDILHAGHVRYLERAAELGSVLLVAVNSDASVKRLKGEDRPINPQRDRQLVLAGLASVDYVVTFDEDTPLSLIEALRPDVLVKGGDYTEATIVGAPLVRSYGGVVTTVPLYEGRSTTRTIARMRGNDP